MPKDDEPLFRFGVVADPQYAARPMTMDRYYASSLGKLAAAVDQFNAGPDLAFVVSLGDAIDGEWTSFDDILPVYARLRAPVRFVLGNHDFLVGEDRLEQVPARLGLARGYYDFAVNGYRFVVVDGADLSIFASRAGSENRRQAEAMLATMQGRGDVNANPWNGGLGEAQYAWLHSVLEQAESAGEKVLVFGHFPAYPLGPHALWESARFVDLLTRHDSFVAYFNGHDHAGSYAELKGRHFVTFRGMVETASDTAYARVDLYSDRIEIAGFGSEPRRVLTVAHHSY